MFTKTHERELAEIKAMTYELGKRFQDVLDELKAIERKQDEIAAMPRAGDPSGAEAGGRNGNTVEPTPLHAKEAGASKRATLSVDTDTRPSRRRAVAEAAPVADEVGDDKLDEDEFETVDAVDAVETVDTGEIVDEGAGGEGEESGKRRAKKQRSEARREAKRARNKLEREAADPSLEDE
jgi:hypothetical protein